MYNTLIYRQEPNNPKDGDMFIDTNNDIYTYYGKKKYLVTIMYQNEEIKKLREERKNKLLKIDEKRND